MKPLASIITLTRNNPALILKLKESLEKTIDIFRIEWIVVDNSEMDNKDTHKILSNLKWVTYIDFNNAGNFSSMNNMAAMHAASDILIFLNDDIESNSDFVDRMTTILKSHEQIGCVGAILTYPDFRLQHAGIIFTANACPANLGTKAVRMLNLRPDKVNPDAWEYPIVFAAATGACLAVRKNDFLIVGGFHTEFSWAFEDVDLCLRMKFRLGKITIVDPLTRLTHYESASGGERQITKNLMLFQGRYRHLIKSDFNRFM